MWSGNFEGPRKNRPAVVRPSKREDGEELEEPEDLDNENVEIEERATAPGMFLCEKENWETCYHIDLKDAVCTNVPAHLNDKASSFLLDDLSIAQDKAWVCETYTEMDCKGTRELTAYPGFGRLHAQVNDCIRSIRCSYNNVLLTAPLLGPRTV